jgi:hypothetical protein
MTHLEPKVLLCTPIAMLISIKDGIFSVKIWFKTGSGCAE